MIRRRVLDIEKGLACDRDYMRLAYFELLGFLETERKALRRPTENSLPKHTPYGADGNFSTNTSRFLALGIFEHECNVPVCFDFYANKAASEVIPFLFSLRFSYPSQPSKAHSELALSTRKSATA